MQDTYGSADVLELADVGVPGIGDDEVLVRVRAAALNPADWAIMNGLPYIARPVYGLRKPRTRIRGTDTAGEVAAVGAGVTRLRVGERVFGRGLGAYAEYAKAAEDNLAPMPAGLTFAQAAAVPMAGLVALQAVRDHGNVQAGQAVLINGASGGIGTFAVQIAKALGAHVTGVCSTANVERLTAIGADRVIDYTATDFASQRTQYDFILDNVADHSLAELRRVLAPSGALVPNGGRFDKRWVASGGRVLHAHLLKRSTDPRMRPFLVSPNLADLLVLKELIEAGTVVPILDHSYPLNETRQAMSHVGTGHARGKVVITMEDS